MSDYKLLVSKIKGGHSPNKDVYSSGEIYSIINDGVKISVSFNKVYKGGWEICYGISLDNEDISSAFSERELEGLAVEIREVYIKHTEIKARDVIRSKFNQNNRSMPPTIPESSWKYGDWGR